MAVGVEVDAGVDLVDEAVDEVGLAAHVGVEGVGGDPELVGQPTHGQGAGTLFIQQGEGLLDDEVTGEQAALLASSAGGHCPGASEVHA
jgi:hypothetical protein